MTYRVVIEPSAVNDIRAGYTWYARHASPTVAVRWYNGLIKKVGTLSKMPRRCPKSLEDETYPEELRVLLYGKRGGTYRVLFTIRDDTVRIVFVRHGSQEVVGPGDEP